MECGSTFRIFNIGERGKSENIRDIQDGKEYRKLYENNGCLSNTNNLSNLLNTDGVPIFKSSNTSVWPLFIAINEIPPKERRVSIILSNVLPYVLE